MSLEQDRERYAAAAHAMQTCVAIEMAIDPKPTEPKHLRVGVNSAMVCDGALATLLIEKGLFTLEEYTAALAASMEREVAGYRERLGIPNGVIIE